MRNVRISQDFVPVSEFKAQAAGWLRKIAASGAPLVVTRNGKPAGVLLSPRAFDALNEQAQFVAAVHEGIDDESAGRLRRHSSIARHVKHRRGRSRSSAPRIRPSR